MRFLKSVILSLMMGLGVSASVSAASRDYEINVNKEYVAAEINIEVPDDRTYFITAEEPHSSTEEGKMYDAEYVGTRKLQCVINDSLRKGKWILHVKTAEAGELVNDTGETPSAEGENPETEPAPEPVEGETDEHEDKIDGLKIEFKGSFTKILEVDKNITIADDITGVQMYFRDDTFVVEWTDTTVGDVNIEVMNEATHESLGKKTVSDKEFELELDPTKVKSIVVTIVPAVSKDVDGAAKSYTIEFKNDPQAVLTYEPVEVTNKDAIKLHVSSKGNYYVLVYDNDKEVLKTDFLGEGEFDLDIPTEVGDNNYVAYVVDDRHYMRSTKGYVEKDVIAPALKLSSEYVNVQTLDPSFTFEGKVEDYNTFTINDADVYVEGDHTFKYEYPLKEGVNYVTFKATDKAGNVSEYTADITRIVPKEEPIPWDKIIIGSVIVIFLAVYLYITIRKAKYGKESVRLKNFFGYFKRNPHVKKERASIPLDKKSLFCDLAELLVPVIVIYIFLTQVIGVGVVQSGSMEPTLNVGSTVFYNRLCYSIGKQEIRRGDIVCFKSPEDGKVLSKRVIGLPGDEVSFKDGYVVLNGQICDESDYLDKSIESNSEKTFTVPSDAIFVLGDNRENSYDSRYWTDPYIPINKIMGRFMGQLDFSFQHDVFNKIFQ